jgi:hypothetical protein
LRSYSPPPIWIARKIPFLCQIIAKSFMDPEIEWLCAILSVFGLRFTWVMHNTLGYHSNCIVSLPLTTISLLFESPSLSVFWLCFLFFTSILISLFLLPLFFSRFWQDFCLWCGESVIALYIYMNFRFGGICYSTLTIMVTVLHFAILLSPSQY